MPKDADLKNNRWEYKFEDDSSDDERIPFAKKQSSLEGIGLKTSRNASQQNIKQEEDFEFETKSQVKIEQVANDDMFYDVANNTHSSGGADFDAESPEDVTAFGILAELPTTTVEVIQTGKAVTDLNVKHGVTPTINYEPLPAHNASSRTVSGSGVSDVQPADSVREERLPTQLLDVSSNLGRKPLQDDEFENSSDSEHLYISCVSVLQREDMVDEGTDAQTSDEVKKDDQQTTVDVPAELFGSSLTKLRDERKLVQGKITYQKKKEKSLLQQIDAKNREIERQTHRVEDFHEFKRDALRKWQVAKSMKADLAEEKEGMEAKLEELRQQRTEHESELQGMKKRILHLEDRVEGHGSSSRKSFAMDSQTKALESETNSSGPIDTTLKSRRSIMGVDTEHNVRGCPPAVLVLEASEDDKGMRAKGLQVQKRPLEDRHLETLDAASSKSPEFTMADTAIEESADSTDDFVPLFKRRKVLADGE